MVAVFAPERRGATNEIAVSDTAVHTNRSAGRALQRRRATAMMMPTTEKKPVTTANPDNGIVLPPSGTSKSTPTAWASAAARVVATIAASAAMKPVTASPLSRWVWLVWPDAGPATTPVSFMLFMFVPPSFGNWRAGCVDWQVTALALGVTMRTVAVERPGFRSARTPAPRSQNPESRPRIGPGSPSRSSSCTRPLVTTPNASHHSAASTATRSPPRSASVRTGLLGVVRRQALGQPEPRELVVVERDDLGDRPAGDAQNVDRERQVGALPLPPEVEGDGGLAVHGGEDGAQTLHRLEAALDPVVHHGVAADVQARRGRHRAADVVAQQRGQPVNVGGHAGVGIAAHQLARPGVLLAAGPVLPLGGQVLPQAGAGPLQRAVHRVDRVPEELRHVLRRPAEHVPQDQHGPRSPREALACDQRPPLRPPPPR